MTFPVSTGTGSRCERRKVPVHASSGSWNRTVKRSQTIKWNTTFRVNLPYVFHDELVHLLDESLILGYPREWTDINARFRGEILYEMLCAIPGNSVNFQVTSCQEHSFYLKQKKPVKGKTELFYFYKFEIRNFVRNIIKIYILNWTTNLDWTTF